ncbi:MAG: hypothetical protein P8Y71_29990 [Pseudolabrys sp.]
MYAKYILAVLSIVFLVLAGVRWRRDGGRLGPQSRTWLIVGVIFALVAALIWR